jgi:hypothetical protein
LVFKYPYIKLELPASSSVFRCSTHIYVVEISSTLCLPRPNCGLASDNGCDAIKPNQRRVERSTCPLRRNIQPSHRRLPKPSFKHRRSIGPKSQPGSLQLLGAFSRIRRCTHFYRLYGFIILDKVFDYRNALEAFWRQHQWAIQAIPDPKDSNPVRYAFLAGFTYLLARSFNQRVQIGLQRGMPSLITPEEAEEARNVPDHLRRYESVPEWAMRIPELATTLVIPTHDGVVLQSHGDKRADPDFLAKNILLWTPHIYFT